MALDVPVTFTQNNLFSASSRAAIVWPVWKGSTTKPVQFQPMRKKQCGRLFQKARAYDRRTRTPGSGKHGGALGRVALDVLQVLLFDFLNYATGQLDPSHETIARPEVTNRAFLWRKGTDRERGGRWAEGIRHARRAGGCRET